MKSEFNHVGLAKICGWFGVTRQAYYQQSWRMGELDLESDLLIQKVKSIRANHPMMGVRKLYVKLEPFLYDHQIKIGRDALFDLLSAHNLLIKRRKSFRKTTNSKHYMKKYPNLIKAKEITGPNQVWVSDITYWKMKNSFLYLSFITDTYSHKVVGYAVSKTLETSGPQEALIKALNSIDVHKTKLIHHSDRGAQYCSAKYVNLLKTNGVGISMTESGDPRENAVAERINGILKNEYLFRHKVKNIHQAKQILNDTIDKYNNQRPHMSIGNNTPENIHIGEKMEKPIQLWKSYYKFNKLTE